MLTRILPVFAFVLPAVSSFWNPRAPACKVSGPAYENLGAILDRVEEYLSSRAMVYGIGLSRSIG
jgi:hypothetical protein